jgi:4-amino-4-deoxy-L-arabinose transferase-like glycosyltransferase
VNEHVWLTHAAIPLAIALIVAFALERSRMSAALPALLSLLAAASVIVLAALIVNHVRMPFQIDVMEEVVMQHARRVMHGQSIYPRASPEYVPLAYNALFYILAAPFLLLFGDTLPTLRAVSVIGFAGSGIAIFILVRSYTRSAWWAAIAVGLFCAAYPAMDAYLDTAHADAWLLCCALWGTYLVGCDSRGPRLAGILVLAAAFWFKQHGAVFLGVALLFLTWREGLRKSLAYWLIAIAAGPVLYLAAPPLLGPAFHYFTWQVPSGWSTLTTHSILRVVRFAATHYPVVTLAALFGAYRALRARTIGILDMMLGAALLTALMGALDSGSSNNVFIPMGAFCILSGSIELARLNERAAPWWGVRPALAGALLAFATLLYDPRDFWMPESAPASYAELQATIRALPGTVYAPGIGQLANGPKLYPAGHWVALEDIVRGSHRTAADTALAQRALDPARHPAATAFVLTNAPLGELSAPVSTLAASYTLVQDYGTRFAALAPLPRPFNTGYPRYLYRFTGAGGLTHDP